MLPNMIEYRDCTDDMRSLKTALCIERRMDSYGNCRDWTLSHKTPGYECAGAAMRLVRAECWGVICRIDGVTHGAWYATRERAESELASKGELI